MTIVNDRRGYWVLVLCASAIPMITIGTPAAGPVCIAAEQRLSIATISFALAVGQFVWGAAQSIFGALRDRGGTVRISIYAV